MSQTLTLPSIGDVVDGKFRLERKLGEGGTSTIYAARHEVTEKRFAIKWLAPSLATNAQAVERFVHEAKVCGRYTHPNAVQVYDVGQSQGSYYLLMEYLDGETLETRLERIQRFPVQAACDIAHACAEALEAAHRVGIVHRDIKPSNIFLCRLEGGGGEVPKILDFGISKISYNGLDLSMLTTTTRTVIGTPQYMSPEQMRGQPADPRFDVYGLGVVLYELVSGQRPFDCDTFADLVFKIIETRPAPLDQIADVEPAFAEIVARAMARDIDHRFPNMNALAEALVPYTSYRPPAALALPGYTREARKVRRSRHITQTGLPVPSGAEETIAAASDGSADASPALDGLVTDADFEPPQRPASTEPTLPRTQSPFDPKDPQLFTSNDPARARTQPSFDHHKPLPFASNDAVPLRTQPSFDHASPLPFAPDDPAPLRTQPSFDHANPLPFASNDAAPSRTQPSFDRAKPQLFASSDPAPPQPSGPDDAMPQQPSAAAVIEPSHAAAAEFAVVAPESTPVPVPRTKAPGRAPSLFGKPKLVPAKKSDATTAKRARLAAARPGRPVALAAVAAPPPAARPTPAADRDADPTEQIEFEEDAIRDTRPPPTPRPPGSRLSTASKCGLALTAALGITLTVVAWQTRAGEPRNVVRPSPDESPVASAPPHPTPDRPLEPKAPRARALQTSLVQASTPAPEDAPEPKAETNRTRRSKQARPRASRAPRSSEADVVAGSEGGASPLEKAPRVERSDFVENKSGLALPTAEISRHDF